MGDNTNNVGRFAFVGNIATSTFAKAPQLSHFTTLELYESTVGNSAVRIQAVAPTLSVMSLVSITPMVADSSLPAGFKDSVADTAMEDFRDTIEYYMEDDL